MSLPDGLACALQKYMDSKDSYTREHSLEVSELTRRLCQAVGLNEREALAVEVGALVHDIGKVATYFESESIETWQDLVRELKAGNYCAVDMETGKEYAVPAGKTYSPLIQRAK